MFIYGPIQDITPLLTFDLRGCARLDSRPGSAIPPVSPKLLNQLAISIFFQNRDIKLPQARFRSRATNIEIYLKKSELGVVYYIQRCDENEGVENGSRASSIKIYDTFARSPVKIHRRAFVSCSFVMACNFSGFVNISSETYLEKLSLLN